MSTLRIPALRIAPFALVLTLLACDERSPSAPPSGAVPRELRVLGGDGQQAVAGAPLPEPLVVTAVDAAGRPLPGVAIRLAVVAGGGQVAPQAVTSDGQGFARARWTLGTGAADSQVVEARVDGIPSARLRAHARPDAPAALTLTGGGAAGPVGTALPDSLALTVTDRFGNPVPAVEVAWEVVAGGGAVSPPRSATRADGTAKAQWTLGPRVDSAQGVRARIAGLEPAAFTAHAVTAGVPLRLAKRGGDGQRGPAGGVLAQPLEVVLRMPDGRPVRGALVAWSAPAGAGTVLPAVPRTDSAGAASATWRLGTDAGLAQATATVDEGTLAFTALVEAEAPGEVAVAAGDGGAGPVGAALADSLAVRVRDRFGNPVAGAEVAWEALEGGGSLQPARSRTDAAGMARSRWILGPRVDAPQAARAAVAGLAPVAFRASATTRGAPLRLVKRGGDGQRGPAGGVLADSLAVALRMPDGRPVAGALVTWSVPAQAGTVVPAAPRTDADGAASAAWTVGTRPGLARATATVDDGTLVFTALVHAAAPARVVAVAGGGEGQVATPLPGPLAVRVTDAYGHPVPGAEVEWAVAAGRGRVHPARSAADGQGVARTQWTLGPVAGTVQAASATVAGLPPAAFQATASTQGVPLLLARAGGDGQAGALGRMLPESLTVQLRTREGEPVQGATVTWLVLSGGGTVTPPATVTDEEGRARGAWTLGTAVGPALASARVDDGALSFSATARPGAPAAVRVLRGDGQSTTRGTILPDTVSVRVMDAYGNPVPGAQVRWTVPSGGGRLSERTSTTGADGAAHVRWAVGFTPGENTLVASADGDAEARLRATGTAGALRLHGTSRLVHGTSYGLVERRGHRAAYVTDLQGRRAVGAAITWESTEHPTFPPSAEWDTSSVALLDYRYSDRSLPLPYSIARFGEQRVVFSEPWYRFYRDEHLEPGPGPYPANDTVVVVLRVFTTVGPPHYDEIEQLVPLRLYDDNGWSVRTDTYQGAAWPLGSRTGGRTLTVCVPEPYIFPEDCRTITTTVTP